MLVYCGGQRSCMHLCSWFALSSCNHIFIYVVQLINSHHSLSHWCQTTIFLPLHSETMTKSTHVDPHEDKLDGKKKVLVYRRWVWYQVSLSFQYGKQSWHQQLSINHHHHLVCKEGIIIDINVNQTLQLTLVQKLSSLYLILGQLTGLLLIIVDFTSLIIVQPVPIISPADREALDLYQQLHFNLKMTNKLYTSNTTSY